MTTLRVTLSPESGKGQRRVTDNSKRTKGIFFCTHPIQIRLMYCTCFAVNERSFIVRQNRLRLGIYLSRFLLTSYNHKKINKNSKVELLVEYGTFTHLITDHSCTKMFCIIMITQSLSQYSMCLSIPITAKQMMMLCADRQDRYFTIPGDFCNKEHWICVNNNKKIQHLFSLAWDGSKLLSRVTAWLHSAVGKRLCPKPGE